MAQSGNMMPNATGNTFQRIAYHFKEKDIKEDKD